MAAVIIAGQPYTVTPDPTRRAVYCAEMPMSSDARAARHTGFGIVTAWFDPVGNGARLAWLLLPDGQLAARPAHALRPALNIADRRILPRPAERTERRMG